MKNLLPSLLLAFLLLACEKYDTIASCTDVSGVQITFDNAPCQVPCRKTFNLSEFNLVQGAELTWTLSGPNGPITLDDPKAATIDVDLLEGGVYTITVQVDFPFDGCDFSRDNTFAVGVDPPQPVIKASATSCTVGMCDLKFWQENADTASLSWSFPDGNKRANQDTVLYNFNDAPGTYEICLEACNIGGCTSACVTISVLPKAFILDKNNLNLEKIICIKENADGSFSAIGSNKNQTFTIDISRDGILDTMSLVKLPGLETVYDEFEALACRDMDGNYLAYGTARRGQNIDMYLASFNANFVPNMEETLFQDSTGNEIVNGVTSSINGGVVACGTASGSFKAGMVFFEADPGLVLQKGKVLFSGSAVNQALDILNRGDHYLVAGRARNPGTEEVEAVHFALNSTFEVITNSTTYFGSDYTPTHLVPTSTEVLLVAKKGFATSAIRPLNRNSPEKLFPNADFKQTIVTSDNRLATVGYNGGTDKKPLLQILSLPNLQVLNTVNEPYPVNNGKLFCISETADGGFIMGGTINTGSGDQVLIIRTDSQGEIL